MLRTLTLSLLLGSFAFSCQVPVFRYALERWQSDKYSLQVIHKEPLVKGTLDLINDAQSKSGANPSTLNLEIETINANTLTELEQWSIPGLEMITSFPTHILTAPDDLNVTDPIILDNTTKSSLSSIISSPTRSEIIKRLLKGDSTVYLHVLSGDKLTDDSVRLTLTNALKEAQKTISLPEGVIRPDQIAQAQGNIDFENVLRSSIPLKISFSILSLDPKDPKEQVFLKILLKGKSINELPEQSFIAPIFGRGRCLGLIPISQVSKALITEQCQYLCNACACSVKSQNPGYDLVMQANWDKKLINSSVVVDKEVPELTGTGDFITSSTEQENQSAQTSTNSDSNNPIKPNGTSELIAKQKQLSPILLFISLPLIALLVLGTYFIFKTKEEQ